MPQLDPRSPSYEADFHALHGESVYHGKERMRYFLNGAVIAGVGTFATFHEPSSDPAKRQQVAIDYWKTRKSHADKRFTELKASLTYDLARLREQSRGRLPAPPAETELETLRGYAEDCRIVNKALTDAEKKLKEMREVVDPKLVELDHLLTEKHRVFCEQVKSINV